MLRLVAAAHSLRSGTASGRGRRPAPRRSLLRGVVFATAASAVALCLLSGAGAAQALTLRSERTPGWLPSFSTWAAQLKAPKAPTRVHVSVAPCGARLASQPHGCARLVSPGVAEVRVFAPPDSDGRRRQLRSLFAHELGHVFDFSAGAALRTRFLALLRSSGAWRGGRQADSPSELFADAYRLCALYGPRATWANLMDLGWYDWEPTPRQHRAACALIAAAPRH